MITVANIKKGGENLPGVKIYIGRNYGKWKRSPLANDIPITATKSREQVIKEYKAWIGGPWDIMPLERSLELERIYKISLEQDVVLLCWCKQPDKFVACHGDVVKEILEAWLAEV